MRAELAQQVEELSARVERDETALADRVTAVVRPMLRRVRDELAERQGNGVADPEVRPPAHTLSSTVLYCSSTKNSLMQWPSVRICFLDSRTAGGKSCSSQSCVFNEFRDYYALVS